VKTNEAIMRWRFFTRRVSQLRPQWRVLTRIIHEFAVKLAAKRAVILLAILVLLSVIDAWPAPDMSSSSQRASRLCGLGDAQGGDRTQSKPLHTAHGALVDATGKAAHLAGVNWFGLETQSLAPHGLDVRNYQDMLNQMAHLDFNTLRLPYSNHLFDSASRPSGIDYTLNPDLRGLPSATNATS
jgi:hypothetical protein